MTVTVKISRKTRAERRGSKRTVYTVGTKTNWIQSVDSSKVSHVTTRDYKLNTHKELLCRFISPKLSYTDCCHCLKTRLFVNACVELVLQLPELTWARCFWWSSRPPPGWPSRYPWLGPRYWTHLDPCSRTRYNAYPRLHLCSHLKR